MKTLIILTLILLITACMSNEVSPKKTLIESPQFATASPTFTEPKDWVRAEKQSVITFTAPEGNLTLSLVTVSSATEPELA